jgi:GAF domain-containing protein
MIAAPLPSDEADRLQALRDLAVLDTPAEARFDRLVARAAREFAVPMALISLVDGQRLWFKARVGVDMTQLPRPIAFCNHAILSPRMLVVEDALNDVRFFDSPVVSGGPGVRFYAGAPLTLPDGQAVGTLCIMDTHPRRLDRAALDTLGRLRDEVVQQLLLTPEAVAA